jgi:[acyl-carrier-protein] S-malonyltransferase
MTAYLFSGQGSQYVGMASSLVQQYEQAAQMMQQACDIAGFALDTICFEGPAELLKETRYTQPALFVHEAIAWSLLQNKHAGAVAGHSLGEYSALYAAGVLSFADAMKLVLLRGSLMFRAGEKRPGTMFAVIGLADEKVEQLCQELSGEHGIIVAANFNSPGQIVLSGDAAWLREKAPEFKAAGARMVTELQVSGAFHSPLMQDAAAELGSAIADTQFMAPACPVYCNASAMPETDPERIRELLLKQLTSPVLWAQSLLAMYSSGIRSYCEIGPGKVLQGLVKRSLPADASLIINGIDKAEDLV